MAPSKVRSKRLAEFEEQLAKDYDPEADAPAHDSDGSDSEGDSDGVGGTEHYVSVGKSKLRQADPVSLGPQYRGKRVSRAALDDSTDDGEGASEGDEEDEDGDSEPEEFDDPQDYDLDAEVDDEDEEIDSDEAFCESDQEKFANFTFRGSSHPKILDPRRKKRPIAADFLSDSEDGSERGPLGGSLNGSEDLIDEDEDEEDNDDDDNEQGSEDGISGSDAEDESDDASEEDEENDGGGADRAELRKIMSEGQRSIVATMSQAAKADVDKGRAVRQQRRSFDMLLNIRIRLQKALVAANSLSVVPEGEDQDRETVGEEPYQAAEEAALKLWSSIETFRESLLPASSASSTATGQKRKRGSPAGLDTPLEDLWEEMQAVETRAAAHRRKVLEKWSNKVRNTSAATTTRKLGAAAPVQSLTSVLDDQLVNSDRLVRRTRVPRSCAPVQASRKVEEDAGIYDDADFYQLLLKELVDQRTMDPSSSSAAASSGSGGGASSLLSSPVPTLRWATAAAREARTRKTVDRRASKGRKLRFTVHEKLQNFMAPEDRRAWEQDAIDRFFGTLFGQKMEVLREDEDEEMGGASLEEQGLRLFRS